MLNPLKRIGQSAGARAVTYPPIHHAAAFREVSLTPGKPAIPTLSSPGPRRILDQVLGVFFQSQPVRDTSGLVIEVQEERPLSLRVDQRPADCYCPIVMRAKPAHQTSVLLYAVKPARGLRGPFLGWLIGAPCHRLRRAEHCGRGNPSARFRLASAMLRIADRSLAEEAPSLVQLRALDRPAHTRNTVSHLVIGSFPREARLGWRRQRRSLFPVRRVRQLASRQLKNLSGMRGNSNVPAALTPAEATLKRRIAKQPINAPGRKAGAGGG